jgi:hypothetical protein
LRKTIRAPLRKCRLLLGLTTGVLSQHTGAQDLADLPRRLVELRLSLVDLRNDCYRVVFPRTGERTTYSGKSDYLYSIVSPNGLSLFGVRRQFDASNRYQFDTLIRRELQKSGASSEEIISVPFDNVFQLAVSPNEKLLVIAGRLRDPGAPGAKQDGIFLLDRKVGNVRTIAPYASLSVQIRSFNVSDQGRVIYEDNGTIMAFMGSEARPKLIELHRGRLPVLKPNGGGYFYASDESLILNDGKSKRELFSAIHVVGAIRISPDANFIAFGVGAEQGGETQLRVCEMQSKACVNGPKYSEWIAGRETFWIKR